MYKWVLKLYFNLYFILDVNTHTRAGKTGYSKFGKGKVGALLGLRTPYFTPDNIYNVDEGDISTVPTNRLKCLNSEETKLEACLWQKGCLSASSNSLPTTFVFPRARENKELLEDAVSGSTAECLPGGSMQKEIYLKWFHRFIAPILLLLLVTANTARAWGSFNSHAKATLSFCHFRLTHHSQATSSHPAVFRWNAEMALVASG